MRRLVLESAAAVAAALATIAPAAAQFHQAHHHAVAAGPTFHHFSVQQSTPAGVVGQSITTAQTAGHHHRQIYGGYTAYAPLIGWSYASGGYPLGWSSIYTPYYTSGFGVQPFGPFYYSYSYPAVVPAAGPVVPQAAPAPPAEREARRLERNAPPQEPARPEPKISNAEQKAKAGRFIGLGDTHFGKQKYTAALDRYRSAAATAPDLPEIFLREGFAYVALGRYANAAKSFRRALAMRGDWSTSPLRIDQLYDEGAW